MESLRSILDPPSRSKPAIRNHSGGSGNASPTAYQSTLPLESGLPEVVVKIAVLGGTSVGKSTVIQRFCSDVKGTRAAKASSGRYDPTLGIDVTSCRLGARAGQPVHVQFWEVAFPEIEAAAAGSVTSTNQLQACFSNAHGVIIAYDTSSAMSFLSVDGCLDAVARDWRLAIGPLVLFGCKSDLKATGDASGITDTEIYDYCTAAGYSNWWSCSAKDDTASSITNAVAEVVRSAIVSFRLLPVDSPPPPVGVALSSKATRPLKPARRSDGSASIPSFSEWLDSVGFACGSPESFVITARGNGDVTVSKSSRHRVPHNPVCRASMWSSSDDSEFVGKVRDDAVKQVSTIASTLLGQPSLTVLPRITVHTTAAPKQTSMLPPSVVCKTVADILHPVVRKESSFAGVHEEVRVSISNQDGETFLAGVGFPQPLLTPLGDIASYDDDEITLADGESEQLEYRYKVGVSLLTDWFLAFCESCEDQFPVATSDLNSGYFSRVMDLWSQFKQLSLTKLRGFKKAKAKSMDAVVGLESFRKSLLPECREWTKTLCVVTKLR